MGRGLCHHLSSWWQQAGLLASSSSSPAPSQAGEPAWWYYAGLFLVTVAGPLKDLHLIPYSPSRAPVADMNIIFYYTLPDQTALHKGFYPGAGLPGYPL